MTIKYNVISDYNALNDFIRWLPELEQHETFYYSLLARHKYVKDAGIGTLNSDKHQCVRFVANKGRLLLKIRQTECPIGAYAVKGVEVPQCALASYITINPRSHKKAAAYALKRLASVVADNEPSPNVYQEALTALHKSVSRKLFADFDFDNVDVSVVTKQLKEVINQDAVNILMTRGGFHAIVRLDSVEQKYVKTFYRDISAIDGVDIVGDNLIPVPGCYQGGFVPYMKPLSYF